MSELLALEGMGVVLAVATATSLAAVVVVTGMLVVDRASLRSKLREIDDVYHLVDIRDQELLVPFVGRVISPVVRALTKVGWRFSPSGWLDEMRSMLRRAGRSEADTDRYLAMRVLTTLAAPFVAVVAWTSTGSLGGMMRPAVTGLAVAACTILPSRRLRSEVETREAAILRQLPDVMDLLVICMEAGLGFTSAVSRTVANVEGALSDELTIALGEMRAGASRAEALESLAERTRIREVRTFVGAIRQADQFGVSVSAVLRDQSDDMRIARRLAAQEKAQKAPVKMLVPMVFCIFPPMFTVVIGPAALGLTASGGL